MLELLSEWAQLGELPACNKEVLPGVRAPERNLSTLSAVPGRVGEDVRPE